MFNIVTNFIQIEGVLYKVKRTLKESSNPDIEVCNEYLNTDKVFKREGILYFLETIKEAEEVIEDVVETEN